MNEIGCYASHLALWKTCLQLNQPIIILEDDFRLTDQFAEAVPLIKTLTERYGFIRLQRFERRRKLLKRLRPAAYLIHEYNASKLYYLSDVPLCTLAYAISPQAAESLVKTSTTLIAPVDKFLQQTWVHKTPIHALSPAPVGESAHTESSTIGIRPRKRINPWCLIERAIYKSKGEMKRIGFDRQQLKRLGHN